MQDDETPSTSTGFSSEFETSLTLLKSLRESRFSSLAAALEAQIDSSGLVPDRLGFDDNFHKQTLKEYLRLHTLKPVPTVQSLVNSGKWKTTNSRVQTKKETYNQVSLLLRRSHGQGVPQKFFHSLQGSFRYQYRIIGHIERTYNVRFDRTGQFILTGSDDTLVKVWDMSQAMLRYTFRGASSVVSDMDISYCNQFMVTAGSDKTVRIWDLQNGAMLQVYKSHSNSICLILFLPKVFHDRRWIVSFGNDCNVIFYEFDGKQKQFEFRRVIFNVRTAPGLKVVSGTNSSCGNWVAAGDSHGYVHLFRFENDNYVVDKDFKAVPAQEKLDTLEWAHHGVVFIAFSSRHYVGRIWRFLRDSWHYLELSPKILDDSMINILHSTKVKYGISMAIWSLDDSKVIVSGTDYKVRIFDAFTAQELHCLDGHKSFAYHLKIHPTHPLVVASLGHDGLILIWDIEQGKQLNMFTNESSDDDGDVISSAILDCAFSPNSTSLAVVDDGGRLTVYGYGENEHYKAPKEQFFSSDYTPTISDEDDFPIDPQTGQAPHLSSPPWIIDLRENPLDEKWQKKVPGREGYDDGAELACPWMTRSIIPKLDEEASAQWAKNQTELSIANWENIKMCNGCAKYKALGNEAPVPPKPPSNRRRTHVPTIEEVNRARAELQQQFLDDYRSEDDEDYEGEEDEGQEAPNEEDGEDTSDESYGGSRNSTQEENSEQVEGVRTSSGRLSTRRRQTPQPVVAENRPPRRRNRRHAVETEDHIEDESSRDVPLDEGSENVEGEEEAPGPSDRPARAARAPKKANVDEYLKTFPSFMQEVRPKRFPYFPQVGDSVVYCKQGHLTYIQECQHRNLYKIKKQPPQNLKAEEFCTVEEVKYMRTPYRLVSVRLAIQNRANEPSRNSFVVKFHEIVGCVDFIILRQMYDKAVVTDRLDEGAEIEAVFDNMWYTGFVASRSAVSEDYPNSNWSCLKIRWATGEEENFSPWECQAKTRGRKNEEPTEGELLIEYSPSEEDWPGNNPRPERNMEEHCNRLSTAINKLSGIETTLPFAEPVSLQEYPDYPELVDYCIDLTTIDQRLKNKYYRRLRAVQHDIRQIAVAAEQYNDPQSDLVRNARRLVEALIRFSKSDFFHAEDFVTFYDSMFDLEDNEITAYRQIPRPTISKEILELAAAGAPQVAPEAGWKRETRRILETAFKQSCAKPFYDKDTVEDNAIRTALNEEGDLKSVINELDSFTSPVEVIEKVKIITETCREVTPRDGAQRRVYDGALQVVKIVEQKMKTVVDNYNAIVNSVESRGFSVQRALRKRIPKPNTSAYQTRSHRAENSSEVRIESTYDSGPSTSIAATAEQRATRALRRTNSGETSSSAARESTIERETPARRVSNRRRTTRSSTESLPTTDTEEVIPARSQRRAYQRLQEELREDLDDIIEANEQRIDARRSAKRGKRKHSRSDTDGEYFSSSSTQSPSVRFSRRSTRNRRDESEERESPSMPSVSSFGRIRRPRVLD